MRASDVSGVDVDTVMTLMMTMWMTMMMLRKAYR
jgi:hypothetical protein